LSRIIVIDDSFIAHAASRADRGASWWALQWLRTSNFFRPTDQIVVFNTGTGLKYR
jgi:hypothetical protein